MFWILLYLRTFIFKFVRGEGSGIWYCIVLNCIALQKNCIIKKTTIIFSITIIFKFVCGEGGCMKYCILLNFIVNN